MNQVDDRDDRLASLLAGVRVEPDPVLWTRVRARLEAGEPVGGVIGWLMRPAALLASLAALGLSLSLSVVIVRSTEPAMRAGETNLADALLALPASPAEELVTLPKSAGPAPADTQAAP